MSWTEASMPPEPGRDGADGSPGILLPVWPAPSTVRAFVTLRAGGSSRGPWGRAGGAPGGWNLGAHCGDDPDDVGRNRALLRALLPAEPVWLDQVHGTEVLDADQPRPADAAPARADAAVCTGRGVVLAVLTADCLPVLFTNAGGTVAAVAHAGWRGLAAGVLERTVDALERRSSDRRWIAWLGPAIGPAHFEVGDEVRHAFVSVHADAAGAFSPGMAKGKWMADLPALARLRLTRRGVASVHAGGYCTFSDPGRFYSYRRDRVTGRMASILLLG